MEQNAFTFLKDEFSEPYEYCKNMEEELVDEKFDNSCVNGRKALEVLVDIIIKNESIKKSKYEYGTVDSKLHNKLQLIRRSKTTITSDILNKCDNVRKMGNKASHPKNKILEEDCRNTHQYLYEIFQFFYERYSILCDKSKIKIYPGVLYKKIDENEDLKRRMKEIEEKIDTLTGSTSDKPKKISWIKEHTFNQKKGSFLIYELSKLMDSSKEAVEGSGYLSEFKEYMHINRTIQKELVTKLEIASKMNSSQLILLCGSVGDGKSHLISYLNKNHSDLMKNFNYWNDATESNDPSKTCIDTLSEILSNFNDTNIDNNSEKLIISINLGVLNNFIDSEYALNNYTKLSKLIKDLNIFDTNKSSTKEDSTCLTLINFGDYNLFEFDESKDNKVYSKYIKQLFNKITSPVKDNPFYQAFLKDKNNDIKSPVLYNYIMFSDDKVQDIIIENIIKIIIKYKKIISTRELLNFIYEILVPYDHVIIKNNESFIQYLECLLPNLIFNTTDRCDILEFLHKEDPTLKRNELTDDLLMKLNVTDKFSDTMSKYMDMNSLLFFKDYIDNINISNLKDEERSVIISTIIRCMNIFGNPDIKDLFTKKSYIDYVNYLYYYNKGEVKQLRTLYKEVESAIYTWKGRFNTKNICIQQIGSFLITKQFNIKPTNLNEEILIDPDNENRFKTELSLEYTLSGVDEDKILKIDYQLYELITKLNRGYKPNKNEQKDLLLFNDFIDDLINLDNEKQFIIHHLKDNVSFELELNGFGEYVFTRC
ncbi:DNA phosphorothioation-dependent restriction protein DptF [Methanosphaera sp. ISO3-F5]|uniref:DNA phosphorothioation-dependent restriction protein DptF n=1 Tax=Methanosphaera sp. ISO3-F5 TaxID=1452353 RepID=UPI002B26435A|nr:DNA phosphorothioation-dependent restriction protein DptF [Methanosphaera sp. ISO3-F5]WQH63907.1 DNA phosphorothioation-dependent restriction protein DptF [Methanosphaera sp. ISO3-F5]